MIASIGTTVHALPTAAVAVNRDLKIFSANKIFYKIIAKHGFEEGAVTTFSHLILDKKQLKIIRSIIWDEEQMDGNSFETFFHVNENKVSLEIDVSEEFIEDGKQLKLLLIKDRSDTYNLLRDLQKNDKRYTELITSMPDIMLMNNQTGDYLFYINPEQFDSEDGFLRIGSDTNELPIPEKIREMTLEAFDKFKKTGEPQILKSFFENSQGELRIYESKVSVDSENRLVSISRDITDFKLLEMKLEESERQLRLALESNNDGIFDWNLYKDKVYFSPSWKEMLGYKDDEIENVFSSWEKLVHPDDLDRTWENLLLHLRNKTEKYSTEFRMLTKQGTYKWLLARGKVIERDGQGRALRLLGTHTDITSLKLFEKELVEKNKQLEEFAHIATHRLRRPVANLKGLINLLETNGDENDIEFTTKKIKESVRELDHEIMSLNRSILLSKVEAQDNTEKDEKVKTVFLIDDDNINNVINEKIISRFKINFHTFKNIHEPLKFISNGISKPNLILIDVYMEADNGWKFIQELHELDIICDIVVLTTIINSSDVEKFRKFEKVKDVWLKPLTSSMIKQHLNL
jgi:PAS domain S-box-containing protein